MRSSRRSDAAFGGAPRERSLRSAPQSVEDQDEAASVAAQNRHEPMRGDTVADGSAAAAGGWSRLGPLGPGTARTPAAAIEAVATKSRFSCFTADDDDELTEMVQAAGVSTSGGADVKSAIPCVRGFVKGTVEKINRVQKSGVERVKVDGARDFVWRSSVGAASVQQSSRTR